VPWAVLAGARAAARLAFLLGSAGLLRFDTALAGLLRLLAFVLLWGSVAAGAWMLRRMAAD
jgi:hypothetical protein